MTAHTALRDDFVSVLARGGMGDGPARRVADRLVHLVVLHGLLPEATDATKETPA